MTSAPTIHTAFVPIFALRAEKKPGDGHTKESVQAEHSKRVAENKTPNWFENRSLLELIGSAIGATGIIAGVVSYFKESTVGKWLSSITILGGGGILVAGFAKAVDFLTNSTGNNSNENNPPDPNNNPLGLPKLSDLFPVTPDAVYIDNLLDPSLSDEQREQKIFAYLDNPNDSKNTPVLMALINSPLVSDEDKSNIIKHYLNDKDSLISLLSSENYILASSAALRCYDRGIQEAIEPIYQLLEKDNLSTEERYAQIDTVAYTLARFKDDRGINYLLTALSDASEGVRAESAEALGKLGDERAVDPLITALRPDKNNIRFTDTFAQALKTLCNPRAQNSEAILAKLRNNESAIDTLINALTFNNAVTRLYLIEILGNIGDKKALGSLEKLQKTDGGYLQGALRKAIEKIKAGQKTE